MSSTTGIDLRLPGFIPGLDVPPENNIVLTVGTHFLIAALSTLVIISRPRTLTVLRIALCLAATSALWKYSLYPHNTPRRITETGLAVVGMYGMMWVIGVCIVGLLVGVHSPPRWVADDKIAPLPTTAPGRLGHAVDDLFSLRGTSIFKNTTWDWIAPSNRRRLPHPNTPRAIFLRNGMWSLLKQYLVHDALDALNKSQI